MTPRVTIVSSADDRYAQLLFELIDSIRAHPQSQGVDVSVISAGMSAPVAAEARARADNFAEGRWHYPGVEKRYRGQDWLKGRLAKVFLPEYFPGYDIYIWLDADAWVCDWRAIELFIRGAARCGYAATMDDVPTRLDWPGKVTWLLGVLPIVKTYGYKHSLRALLPVATMRRLTMTRSFNGGAFALHRDAPHWRVVQERLRRLTKYGHVFGSNQLAFVMAVKFDGLPVEILPFWCNYLGTPKVCAASGCFVEPYLPHTPIGVLHLADRDDVRLDPDCEVDLLDTEGRSVRRSLRYRPEFIAGSGSGAAVARPLVAALTNH